MRAEIEGAGWRIVDRGTDFALSLAAPPDLADGDRVRYGSSQSVPSRLGEAAVGIATVVLIATDWPEDFARTLAGLRATSPDGTSVVIVANHPSPEQAAGLDAIDKLPAGTDRSPAVEVTWTSERLGYAAATNVGLRRASGPVVILLDPSVEASGDIVTPLVRALDDPSIAVAGGWGRTSKEMRTFEDAAYGDVDAIDGSCQAFRRSDAAERGLLDERFLSDAYLGIWWSFVLRDGGDGETQRRAVRVAGLPAIRHDRSGDGSPADATRDRQAKRNFYRLLDRFGGRRDLLIRAVEG